MDVIRSTPEVNVAMESHTGVWNRGKLTRLAGATVLGLTAALAVAGTLWAAGQLLWQQDGIPVCSAPGTQEYVRLVGDQAGGAILAWHDDPFGISGPDARSDVYAQHVYPNGATAWGPTGISLCTATGRQENLQIVSDGAGGAIVTWEDYRSGERDIYAQRVLTDGTVAWITDGAPVCTSSGFQGNPQILSDQAGGAIIVWADPRDGLTDIYAQRVYSDGSTAWTANGIPLCTDPAGQSFPQLASDGTGGAIVAWSDGRGGIYAQRVYSNGSVAWATDGISVCTTVGGYPQIVSDRAGGAIVVWQDSRAGWINEDIYAQRVHSDGSTGWATDGVALCTAPGIQELPKIASDGSGGAIAVWTDSRNDSGDFPNDDIYSQRVYSDGTMAWATDGITLCSLSREQRHPEIVSDGMGGAIVVWDDMRSLKTDIYVQQMYSDGTFAWPQDGYLICGANYFQDDPSITEDGTGGVIVAWEDYRTESEANIYAQRIKSLNTSIYLPSAVQGYSP
jgi:hypothetical protein